MVASVSMNGVPKILVGLPYSAGGALAHAASQLGAPTLISMGSLQRKDKNEKWGFTPIGTAAWSTGAALDSAGFSAMKAGGYRWTVDEHVEFVATNRGDGSMPFPWAWWSAMDYCCEPEIAANRAEVAERMRLTIESLRETLEDVDYWRHEGIHLSDPMPVLQGRRPSDYLSSFEAIAEVFAEAGRELPTLMGVGSVCSRDLHGTEGLLTILAALHAALPSSVRLHLFGVKGSALSHIEDVAPDRVASIDSMAWDLRAKKENCVVNKAKANELGITLTELKGTQDWSVNTVEKRAGHMRAWHARQKARLPGGHGTAGEDLVAASPPPQHQATSPDSFTDLLIRTVARDGSVVSAKRVECLVLGASGAVDSRATRRQIRFAFRSMSALYCDAPLTLESSPGQWALTAAGIERAHELEKT